MSKMKEGGNYKHGDYVQVNEFPIDLLPAFISRKSSALKLDARKSTMYHDEHEEEEDIELSLGLSLNGRFGFDPKRENRLSRSSSIPDFMTAESHKSVAVKSLPSAHAPLSRACSLPTESAEEWRKRKELQSLRRLEAKRKRMEKLKSPKTGRDLHDNGDVRAKKGQVVVNGHGEFSLPFGLPKSSWADNGQGTVIKAEKPPLFRQGSIGSQGSGSSGISESECLPPQGMTVANRKVEESTVGQVKEEKRQRLIVGSDEAKEMLKNVLLDMPYVSTTGEGAEGKRIEGFLYRYKKGEEAMIVCVCHGTFLSPAEFVKHGGGGGSGGADVSHPLRHIIVNPSPLFLKKQR